MAYNKTIQQKATAKYRAQKIDLIQFPTGKGNREKLKRYCNQKGISMSQFINRLIAEELKKEPGYDWVEGH
ncbi:MAG: hypothetical protein HUJ76_08595 [Parasporobacterium sp.]|nr:hypothetical protein [Parasporobacterium sp.]